MDLNQSRDAADAYDLGLDDHDLLLCLDMEMNRPSYTPQGETMTIPIRIVHDAAHVSALTCVETIQSLLREEERGDAYKAFFQIIHAGMEAAFLFADREKRRLHPLAQSEVECERN